ncbi:MAG: hypothetical protein WCP85_04195 [Mariniphaga sp.]
MTKIANYYFEMKIAIKKFVILLVAVVILFLAGRIFLIYFTKTGIEASVQSMQHCCFETLNGELKYIDEFNSQNPNIIMYFHPECEHCQYEASEFGKNQELWGKANIIMITPDTLTERIKIFAIQYHLIGIKNLVILLDRKNTFEHYFGTSIIPTFYIYGADQKLIKKYSGETKISAIINIIN